MIKKILILFIINFFVFFNCYALDFNNVYNVKTFSSATLEINDTNLVDQENAENLLENIENLNDALILKSEEIIEQNRNRKTPKFKGAEDIFNDYSNSVVYIGTRKKTKWVSSGSGFVVNHKGLKIITNWHVIDGADRIGVWLKPKNLNIGDAEYLIENEDSFQAEIINVNKKKDLAMLKVSKLPLITKPVKYGKFKNVKIGETLFAIGHPEGLLWTFSSGMVSQIRPNYDWKYRTSRHHANVIQIQVPINPGNSGGPLFNKNKELVGVNTFTAEGENLNFAIAVDDVIDFLNEKPKKNKKTNNNWIKKKKKGPTWIKKKDKKKSDGSIDLSNSKEADINNNGVIDAWLFDENNNGIYEYAYGDTDENGIIDILVVDKNENKIYEFTFIDTDEDGNPNIAEYDEDEDGKIDVLAYDYDQDGEWDKFENL